LARFIGASRAAATTSTPAVPPILQQASYPPPATKIADDKLGASYGPDSLSDAERDLYSFNNPPPYTPEAMDALAREMMKGGVVPSMKSLADAKKATRFVKPVGTDQATRKTFKPRDPGRPLSVRFNLQEGQYKGMWVVEDESTGQRFYYDPEKTSLRMESPLLHNEPSGASKIFDAQKKVDKNTAAGVESSKDLLKAARKQAVARVLASKVEALPIESIGDEVSSLLNVGYNPKKAPYWRNIQTDQNIDLTPGKTAVTKGRQVFGDFAAPTAPQASAAEPVAKPEQPAKAAKGTAKKAQPKVPQKQTVKSLQQYFDFISNTPTGKSAKSKSTTASSAPASGATFSQSVDAALASSPAMAKKMASGQTLGEIVSMAVRNIYNSKAVHKATPKELRDMYQQFMDAIDDVASKSGVSSADIAEAQGLFNRIVGDHKLTQ
jgi:hypothetical protein